MVKFEHTTYSLGFKVSPELLMDDLYGYCQQRTGVIDIPIGPPPQRKIADWPPKPDDLNVRWWEK